MATHKSGCGGELCFAGLSTSSLLFNCEQQRKDTKKQESHSFVSYLTFLRNIHVLSTHSSHVQ